MTAIQSEIVNKLVIKLTRNTWLQASRKTFAMFSTFLTVSGALLLIQSQILPFFIKNTVVISSLQQKATTIVFVMLCVLSMATLMLFTFYYSLEQKIDKPERVVLVVIIIYSMMQFEYIQASSNDLITNIQYVAGPQTIIPSMLIATGVVLLYKYIQKILDRIIHKNIPPAVVQSIKRFTVFMITLLIATCVEEIIKAISKQDTIPLLVQFVHQPMMYLMSNIFVVIIILSIGNVLFYLGMHQSIMNDSFLFPFLMIAMFENIAANLQYGGSPYVVTNIAIVIFGMIGGSGNTLSLLLAMYIVRDKHTEEQHTLSKIASVPSLFNINEPLLFGVPIILNKYLFWPFMLMPIIGITAYYFGVKLQLIGEIMYPTQWNIPVLLNTLLATGGDFRTVILQAIVVVLGICCYVPFLIAQKRKQDVK